MTMKRMALATIGMVALTIFTGAATDPNLNHPKGAHWSTMNGRSIPMAQDKGGDLFLSWASQSIQKLPSLELNDASPESAAIGRMVGSARIVALSEAVHDGAEPLIFRNNLLKLLVEHYGFTAIAIESGVTEGQVVDDYVHGGPGDLKSVMRQGFGWTFDRLPQNEALVRWLREYNADPTHKQKISFYGFDVPGSPGNPEARRGPETALVAALDYLEKVDPNAAADFRARVQEILPFLNFNPLAAPGAKHQYTSLTSQDRNRLTASITDLISLFRIKKAAYTAATSEQAYQRAYRNAVCARQMDNFLRQVPLNWKPLRPSPEMKWPKWLWEAEETRNRAMADNLEWILQQEGPSGKILVYAARFHLAMTPMVEVQAPTEGPYHPAGWYLKQQFGRQLVTIGNFIAGGSFGCGNLHGTLQNSPASFDRFLLKLNAPLFLLDIRKAPPPVVAWLSQTHEQDPASGPVARAWDIILFMQNSTPACL